MLHYRLPKIPSKAFGFFSHDGVIYIGNNFKLKICRHMLPDIYALLLTAADVILLIESFL
jgi:hypothetical protein